MPPRATSLVVSHQHPTRFTLVAATVLLLAASVAGALPPSLFVEVDEIPLPAECLVGFGNNLKARPIGFTPTGSLLYICVYNDFGSDDRPLHVFESAAPYRSSRLLFKAVGRFDGTGENYVLSPDGSLLVLRRGMLELRELPSGRILRALPDAGGGVEFVPDNVHLEFGGKLVAVATLDALDSQEAAEVRAMWPASWRRNGAAADPAGVLAWEPSDGRGGASGRLVGLGADTGQVVYEIPKIEACPARWAASGEMLSFCYRKGGEEGYRKGLAVARIVGNPPPRLVTSVAFDDKATGGNGVLEAAEVVFLEVQTRNDGAGASGELTFELVDPEGVVGDRPTVRGSGLPPGGSSVTRIRLTAPATLGHGILKLQLDVREARGFDAAKQVLALKTAAATFPKLAIEPGVVVYDAHESPVVAPTYRQSAADLGVSSSCSKRGKRSGHGWAEFARVTGSVIDGCAGALKGSARADQLVGALDGWVELGARILPNARLEPLALRPPTKGRPAIRGVGASLDTKAFLSCMERDLRVRSSSWTFPEAATPNAKDCRLDVSFRLLAAEGRQREPPLHALGNGDGRLNSGEKVRLEFKVTNTGDGPSFRPRLHVQLAQAHCPESFLELPVDTSRTSGCSFALPAVRPETGAAIEVLEPGETAAFRVFLTVSQMPSYEILPVGLQAAERRTRPGFLDEVLAGIEIPIVRLAPRFRAEATIVDANEAGMSGNGDGNLQRGETAVVRITITNDGSAPAMPLEAVATVESDAFTLQHSSAAFTVVPVGSSVRHDVIVTVKRSAKPGPFSVRYQLRPGAFPEQQALLPLTLEAETIAEVAIGAMAPSAPPTPAPSLALAARHLRRERVEFRKGFPRDLQAVVIDLVTALVDDDHARIATFERIPGALNEAFMPCSNNAELEVSASMEESGDIWLAVPKSYMCSCIGKRTGSRWTFGECMFNDGN